MEDFTNTLNKAYRYALALTHDAHSAEDLVQDAWVKILRAGGDKNIGYLRTTIRNLHIDNFRRKKLELVETTDRFADIPDSDELDIDISPEQLEVALGKIRTEEREVLYLMCVEDFSAQEASALLQKPRGTVLSLVHRAKMKMRKVLLGVQNQNRNRGTQ